MEDGLLVNLEGAQRVLPGCFNGSGEMGTKRTLGRLCSYTQSGEVDVTPVRRSFTS